MRNLVKRHILILMTGAVVSLSIAALAAAGYVFFAQERLLESVLLPYVRDMVQALTPDFAGRGRGHGDGQGHHLLASGPSIPGSRILILSPEGQVRGASPGAREMTDLPLKDLMKNREGYERATHGGRDYIVLWKLTGAGDTAFFFIPREKLTASSTGSHRLLTGLLLVLTLALLTLAVALWCTLVAPLRKIAEDVRKLRWGEEMFTASDALRVWEVDVLQRALAQQSENAIESARLRENYVRDIVETQEAERKRFARELHDGPLQYVTAAIRRVQILSALLGGMPKGALRDNVGENLDEAEKAAQFSADEIRDLCEELSPSWLESGLPAALAELAEKLERSEGVSVDLYVSDDAPKLDDEKNLALLRLFQEACSNAIRHGKATNIDATLDGDENEVRLTVRDNGTGFDGASLNLDALRAGRHRGILNMTERIALVRGTFAIDSRPGEGCTVVARVAE